MRGLEVSIVEIRMAGVKVKAFEALTLHTNSHSGRSTLSRNNLARCHFS